MIRVISSEGPGSGCYVVKFISNREIVFQMWIAGRSILRIMKQVIWVLGRMRKPTIDKVIIRWYSERMKATSGRINII